MDWELLDVPVGVSVWRDASGEQQIVAAAYVWHGGFEWCHLGSVTRVPSDPEELASRNGREYFQLFDDEKTLIVGPLATSRAFLRAVVAADLIQPATLTSSSWPSGDRQEVDVWPPLDLPHRASLQPQVPWDAPELFPNDKSARVAKYRMLQSRYRQEVLGAKAGESGDHKTLGSYLDADEVAANPQLNFLNPVALAHAMEREVIVKKQGGALDPARLHHNMLSSMPLCFNLFGTMRAEDDFLGVFQALFDPEATAIFEIVCEWAPQPPSEYLGDGTAFDAIVFYNTASGRRFCGIETKYTEPFSQKIYSRARYDEVTTISGWFVHPETAPNVLKGPASNQLWRNLMLAASLEMEGTYGTGRIAVVALADDPGAMKAIDIITPALTDPTRLLWVSIESILESAAQHKSLVPWAREFEHRYVG